MKSLGLAGGSNNNDIVRNVLRKVMEPGLAAKYSLYGRKGKKCLKSKVVYSVIVEASRMGGCSSTDSDINAVLMEALKTVSDNIFFHVIVLGQTFDYMQCFIKQLKQLHNVTSTPY